MKTLVKIDLIRYLKQLFDNSDKPYLYFKKGHFFHLFIEAHPLKYQQNDRIIINSNVLCNLIKTMNICSQFKFKKSKVKRYKFIKRKVYDYEKRLFL